jgi:hypothetical protein
MKNRAGSAPLLCRRPIVIALGAEEAQCLLHGSDHAERSLRLTRKPFGAYPPQWSSNDGHAGEEGRFRLSAKPLERWIEEWKYAHRRQTHVDDDAELGASVAWHGSAELCRTLINLAHRLKCLTRSREHHEAQRLEHLNGQKDVLLNYRATLQIVEADSTSRHGVPSDAGPPAQPSSTSRACPETYGHGVPLRRRLLGEADRDALSVGANESLQASYLARHDRPRTRARSPRVVLELSRERGGSPSSRCVRTSPHRNVHTDAPRHPPRAQPHPDTDPQRALAGSS